MEKTELLKEIEEIGKGVAFNATPSNWPHEKRERAKGYENSLFALRLLYRRIKDSENKSDWVVAFRKAFVIVNTGIERNKLDRLYEQI